MIKYMDEQKIPFDKVFSDEPNLAKIKCIELNNDERQFQRFDMQNQEYVFYSNVFNNFTDEQIDELKTKWVVVKEFKQLQVHVELYKKPNQK